MLRVNDLEEGLAQTIPGHSLSQKALGGVSSVLGVAIAPRLFVSGKSGISVGRRTAT
jgi:hypothetical protein